MLLWAQQRNTEQKHKSETRERPGRVSLSTVPLTGTGVASFSFLYSYKYDMSPMVIEKFRYMQTANMNNNKT